MTQEQERIEKEADVSRKGRCKGIRKGLLVGLA